MSANQHDKTKSIWKRTKKKNKNNKKQSKGERLCTPKICSSTKDKIKKTFKNISKNGLSTIEITNILNNLPNFLGVYPQDYLNSLTILSYPVCFVVNLDESYLKGSHWVAISIFDKSIEIYDSLGFNVDLWPNYPIHFIKFLSLYSHSHDFVITPRLQPDNSHLCGLYCIYFLIFRNIFTYQKCLSFFKSDIENDKILLKLLC